MKKRAAAVLAVALAAGSLSLAACGGGKTGGWEILRCGGKPEDRPFRRGGG